MFEQGTRPKLRFQLSKGLCNIEDLWELKLEDLDTIAISLDKELKSTSGAVSFIKSRTNANKTLELKFEIVKRIIEVKLAEKEAKQLAAVKAEKKAKLKELIEKKELTALESKSLEELEAELAALD